MPMFSAAKCTKAQMVWFCWSRLAGMLDELIGSPFIVGAIVHQIFCVNREVIKSERITLLKQKACFVRQMPPTKQGTNDGKESYLPSVSADSAEIFCAKKIGRKVMRMTIVATTFVTGRSRGRTS